MFRSNVACRAIVLLALLALSACGGGGGGGGTGGTTYSISLSQNTLSFSGVFSADPQHQSIVVSFVGDGVVVGTLPGQTKPDWLTVGAPAQSTSPVTVDVVASMLTTPGSYSTTLRFATGKADGSQVVYKDVTINLQVVPGAPIRLIARGISSVDVSINGGAQQTVGSDVAKQLGVIATGSTYTITVPNQPNGWHCTFANGTATQTDVMGSNALDLQLNCNAALIPWAWIGGTQTLGDAAAYGTRLNAAAGNTPGGRIPAAYAADAAGNLWLFGAGNPGGSPDSRNDLWRYDIATGLWTWMSGSTVVNAAGTYGTLGQPASANAPGARYGAAAWIDANGRFWLFGGYGYDAGGSQGELNDLWMYDAASDQWAWVGGSNAVNQSGIYGSTPSTANIPGGREFPAVDKDPAGAVWLFGGNGLAGTGNSFGYLNDLWKFDPATRAWTWVSGSTAPQALGSYGTLGVADAANQPDARMRATIWADANGVFMFGGANFYLGGHNDLWRYDSQSGWWTWVNGTNSTTANGFIAFGRYDPPGTSLIGVPSGRYDASSWKDHAGNLWLFGGSAITGSSSFTPAPVNDLWKYTPSTNSWSWQSGVNAASLPAVRGTQGVASTFNVPSGRTNAVAWPDAAGTLWLWGGLASNTDTLNDVWSVVPQ